MSRSDDSTTSTPAVQPVTVYSELKDKGNWFLTFRPLRLAPGITVTAADFLSDLMSLADRRAHEGDSFLCTSGFLEGAGWTPKESRVRLEFLRQYPTPERPVLFMSTVKRRRYVRLDWAVIRELADHGTEKMKEVRAANKEGDMTPKTAQLPTTSCPKRPNSGGHDAQNGPTSGGGAQNGPTPEDMTPKTAQLQEVVPKTAQLHSDGGGEGDSSADLPSDMVPIWAPHGAQNGPTEAEFGPSGRTKEMSLREIEGEGATKSPPSSVEEIQIPPEDAAQKPLYAPDEPFPEEQLPDEREPKKFFWVWWRIPGKGEIPPIKYHADSCFPVKGYCPRMEYDDRRYAANKKAVPPPPPPKPKFVPPPHVPVGIPREKDEPGRARIRPWTPLANMLLKDIRLGRECFPSALDWEDYCFAGGLLSRPGEPEKRGSSDNKWHGGDAATVRWPQEHIPAAIRDRIWPPDDPEEKPATRNPGENGAGSDELTRADKARAARLQEFVRSQKWVISGARANWAEAFCSLRRRLARSDIPEAEIDHTLDAMVVARLAHPKILHGKDLEAQWAWVRRALNLSDPPPFVTKRAKLLAARLPQHNWHFPPEDLPALVQRCLDAVTPWWEWLKGLEVEPQDAGFRAGVLNRLMSVEYHVRWWMDKWHKALPDLTSWDGNADALVWSPTHKWFRLLLRDLSRQGASDPSKWAKFERKYRGLPCPTK